MEKIFTFDGTEYTVEEITAISYCDDYKEEYRQDALLVTTVADSGEKFVSVVFGYNMPDDEDDFAMMCDDCYAWDSFYETIATVKER